MKSVMKKILAGLLLAAILASLLAVQAFADTTCYHKLTDGKCAYCGEVAKKITVADGIALYSGDNQQPHYENGAYYLFSGSVIFLKLTKIPTGMYFEEWNLTTEGTDHALAGNRLCVGSSDIAIEASFNANKKVNVRINAPLFQVTGHSSMQLGTASISPLAGTSITVTYTGAAFMPNSEVVYWVNENSMIVGTGNEITMTVSNSTSITAICKQGNADSALVVYRNGADRIGTKVIHYLSANQTDVEALTLHPNASVGTLDVIGWRVAGDDRVLTQETYRQAVAEAIESGNILYLEPAISKSTVEVAINVGTLQDSDYALHRIQTVYAKEYVYVNAPATDLGYFSHWEVNGEVIASEILIYKFERNVAYTVVARYSPTPTAVGEAPVVRLDTDAPTGGGKIHLNGIYQIPAGFTLSDAGIVYTTDKALGTTSDFEIDTEGVKVRKASGLEDKENATYNLTLNTTKTEVTVWARAFMTLVNAENQIITVYTDIECISYVGVAS